MIQIQAYKIICKLLISKRVGVFFILACFFNSSFSFAGARVDLYGHPIFLHYQKPSIGLSAPISQSMVSKQLDLIEASSLKNLIEEMDNYSFQFGMDDMAYVLFSRKVSETFYQNTSAARLFQYALLKEKGYNLILGFSEAQITNYAFLDFNVLNCTYVKHQDKTYTDISFSQNMEHCQETIFEPSFGGRAILINEQRPPYFSAVLEKYEYHFEFENSYYFFKGNLNKSLADYYRDLPDIEFGQIYLNYQLSESVRSGLVQDIREAISGMFPSKQIDFILSLTQEALPYDRDHIRVGHEKFSFPEETLANKYGDCEDKSVLFAYLVKEVLQMPSVALVYFSQNHLNVAVGINYKSGYNFTYHNRKYLVCEPSGLGFAPGENIYDLKKADIINW